MTARNLEAARVALERALLLVDTLLQKCDENKNDVGNNNDSTSIISCESSGRRPCTRAGVVVKFALISHAHTKITTKTDWVHGGALRAPLCTEAVVVVIFVWAQYFFANFTRTPAWVHGVPPLLPQMTISALGAWAP